jgi:hypothetical protein
MPQKRKKAVSSPANPKVTGKPIQTQTELAKLVDKNPAQITRWIRDHRWTFARKPPWPRSDLPKILNWVANTLRDESEAGAKKAAAKSSKRADLQERKLVQEIRKLKAMADTAETALAKERGELYDAAEIEQAWASVAVVVRNGLQTIGQRIVDHAMNHGMPLEAAAEFGQRVDEEIAGALRHLSRNGSVETSEGGDGEILPQPVPPGAADPVAVG